jgi:hypothetical protein
VKALLLSRVAWVVIGALAFWALVPSPEPVRYRDVIVTPERIIEQEPDTVVRWRERVVTRVLEPEVVATAPEAGKADVARFCAAEVERAMPSDGLRVSLSVPEPQALLRSVQVDPGYFLSPDKVVLTGPLSTGDLRAWDFTTRTGWSARVSGDSVIFRQPRFQVLKDIGEMLVPFALGIGVGHVIR